MKRLLFLMVMVTLAFIGSTVAYADYSFTFTSNDGSYNVTGTLTTPSNGNGPLTVLGGSVTGTGTSNGGIAYSVIVNPIAPSVTSIRPYSALPGNGTDLIFDNQLTPGSDPFLDGNGLVLQANNSFLASNGSSYSSSYLNIWGNGPGSYTVFALGYDNTNQKELYGPQLNGTANISPIAGAPVPIPAAIYLFGSGMVGLVGLKRKFLGC
ncbi:MAG TPA: hypothetical protein VKF36_06570 [Syntrophorhabdales bacterium]|nr:hypothetical protein [Syntrophorhabdales bacterium]